VAELPGFGTTILGIEFLGQSLQLIDAASDAPPRPIGACWIALAVDAKVGVILALDKEVAALVAV